MGVWYATREQLQRAPDIRETARRGGQLDRALESGARSVRALCHRHFYPLTATRTFDWPNRSYARPWRLWLDQWELISATTVTAGGVVIASTDYLLRPDHGPPFNRLEIDLGSTASLQAGDSHQRAIAIAGEFGYRADEQPAGALAAAIADTSTTTVDVTDSTTTGVGALLRVEAERMIVTGRRMLDTGQDLQNNPAARHDARTVTVSDGTEFAVDEVVQVDAEKMLVVEVTGNNLTVVRAWDGTVLEAHSAGADVFAPRRLTVQRGAVGTTAAPHGDGTALQVWVPPGLATDLNIAEAIVRVQQETATYARTVGSGDHQREASGRGLVDLRTECQAALGRKLRKRAI